MYQDFFSLKEQPFSISPDPDFLFLSDRHKEAIAHLQYGVQGNGGFVLLTGEVGTGKTTVCRKLLQEIAATTDIAFILNPALTEIELLATICDEFQIAYEKDRNSLKHLFDSLTTWMMNNHDQGRSAIVLIDEAQHLSFSVLEQLRLLTNIESNNKKPLQVILIGQTELQQKLKQTEFRQLAQRITARYHLLPLTEQESRYYIQHRLNIAGGCFPIFEAQALREVFRSSEGVPRLINLLCDRSLLCAYTQNSLKVTADMVKKASVEMELSGSHNTFIGSLKSKWRFAALLLLTVVTLWQLPEILLRLEHLKEQSGKLSVEVQAESQSAETLSTAGMQPELQSAEPLPTAALQAESQSAETLSTAALQPESQSVETLSTAALQAESQSVETLSTAALQAESQPAEPLSTAALQAESQSTEPLSTAALQAEAQLTVLPSKTVSVSVSTQQPPVMPGAAAESLNWFDSYPALDTSNATFSNALMNLYAVWGYQTNIETVNCEQGRSVLLSCYSETSSLKKLKQLNYPSVVKLETDDLESLYAVLYRIDNSYQLLIDGQLIEVSETWFNKYWSGDLTLLWQAPFDLQGYMKFGQQNEKVAWLVKQFNKLHQAGLESENRFDLPLLQQVRAFQRDNGLQEDGIVGAKTLMPLLQLANPQLPRLQQEIY
ncbi:AAA family ATPase [Psychromonas sp.]|uniref:ExeA family protein n=1 Tax=Psychromonas sp. TaxID=1884585 RepID=UPI00356AD7CE